MDNIDDAKEACKSLESLLLEKSFAENNSESIFKIALANGLCI